MLEFLNYGRKGDVEGVLSHMFHRGESLEVSGRSPRADELESEYGNSQDRRLQRESQVPDQQRAEYWYHVSLDPASRQGFSERLHSFKWFSFLQLVFLQNCHYYFLMLFTHYTSTLSSKASFEH